MAKPKKKRVTLADLSDGLTELKATTAGLADGLTELRVTTAGLRDDLTGLKVTTAGLRDDLTGLRGELTEHKLTTSAIYDGLMDLKAAVEHGYATHEARFAKLDIYLERRFNTIDTRFDEIEHRFEVIDQPLLTLARWDIRRRTVFEIGEAASIGVLHRENRRRLLRPGEVVTRRR